MPPGLMKKLKVEGSQVFDFIQSAMIPFNKSLDESPGTAALPNKLKDRLLENRNVVNPMS